MLLSESLASKVGCKLRKTVTCYFLAALKQFFECFVDATILLESLAQSLGHFTELVGFTDEAKDAVRNHDSDLAT